MNNTNLTLSDAASMMLGAGLIKIDTNLNTALILIGVAVAIKVLVAYLQKNDIPISYAPPVG